MAKIVISYRRSDSAAITGRIRDRLVTQFGEESIFMDIDNIPFGEDFRAHIRDRLLECDVLLAILGKEWLGRDKDTSSRIMSEVDPVRIEVLTALEAHIPTIPVLVNGAGMPDAAELPHELKNFAFLNAAEVNSGRDFHQHMGRIIEGINGIIAKKTGNASPQRAARGATKASLAWPNWLPFGGLALVLIAGGLGLYWYLKRTPGTEPRQAESASQSMTAASANRDAATPAQTSTLAAHSPPSTATTTTAATNTANCDQTSPTFVDDFKSQTVRWVRLGETSLGSDAYYNNGQMVLLAALQNTKWIVAPDRQFTNITICADVQSPPEANDLGLTAGGLVFWSRPGNMDDVYVASVYPDGSYAIHRKHDGTWSTIGAKRAFSAVRTGLDSENQLKLTLEDSHATLYINGIKAQEFDGEPPGGGGVVGLFARSEPDQQNEWRFRKIVVAQ